MPDSGRPIGDGVLQLDADVSKDVDPPTSLSDKLIDLRHRGLRIVRKDSTCQVPHFLAGRGFGDSLGHAYDDVVRIDLGDAPFPVVAPYRPDHRPGGRREGELDVGADYFAQGRQGDPVLGCKSSGICGAGYRYAACESLCRWPLRARRAVRSFWQRRQAACICCGLLRPGGCRTWLTTSTGSQSRAGTDIRNT